MSSVDSTPPSVDFDRAFQSASTTDGRQVSFFEFWPTWVMYAPVAVQWILLTVWYRSFTLPFLANPNVPVAGMVGMPKSTLLGQATGKAAEVILPWIIYAVGNRPLSQQLDTCLKSAEAIGITLPFVCKPDIGCRGVGVKLIKSRDQLAEVISLYPKGAQLVCQQLASWEPEVGIFYVKNTETGEVSITSMTFKYTPHVVGDGQRTLSELVEADPRAGQLQHLYHARFRERWSEVPESGEVVKLVFSASHSKGAIFKNASEFITEALRLRVAEIMADIPEFFYGRLDVKFRDVASLKLGETLEVVEINGASSESILIWDKDTSLLTAFKELTWQYRTLFKIGAHHRRNGLRPPRLGYFLERLREERRLTRNYPLTD